MQEGNLTMRYIVSDIHGCYDEYKALLQKINFSDEDELYVLGDVVDRGPEPINILLDMMNRQNVIFIMGNHEFIMYTIMKKLTVEITEENCEEYLSAEDILNYNLWLQDGGEITATQFRNLLLSEKLDILDYLSEASIYETIEHDGNEYVLVHAGLANFSPDKSLDEYDLYDFLEERTDYSRRYFPDEHKFLVTGHTPTIYIEGWEKPEVYMENGHIAMDCCCVGGGKLAVYCVETGEVTYVESGN